MGKRIALMRLTWLVVLLFSAILCGQCSKDGPAEKKAEPEKKAEGPSVEAAGDKEGPAPVEPAAEKPKPEISAFPEGATALDEVEALRYLPPDTLMVVVAANTEELLDRLGRETLTKKYARYYEMAVAEVTQVVGQNILIPKNLREVGLDPSAPVGFALLDIPRPVAVAFAKLSDPDKFKTTVYAVAGKLGEKMEPHVVGDALAICPRNDEEVCLVIRDKHLFLHMADMSDEKALEATLRFAGRPLKNSLVDGERFKATVSNLKYGKDVAGYVDFGALAKAVMGVMDADDDWASSSTKYSEEELKKAQDAKDEAQIKYWEERIKEDKEWAERMKKRREAEQKMFSTLFGSLGGGLSFGIELTDKAIKLKTYTQMTEGSMMARAIKPGSGIPILLKALSKRPFYMGTFNIDVKTYMEFIDLLTATEGMSGQEMRAMFTAATQLDLDRDILALLTGEGGFALTGQLEKVFDDEKELFAAIGGSAVLGVTDVEKANSVLEKLAALPLASDFVKKEGSTYVVPVPEWKNVYVSVAGKNIVASTDREFAGAVEKGGGDSFVAKLDNPEMKALLEMEDMAGTALMDFGVFGYFVVGVGRAEWGSEMAAAAHEDVPYSEEYKTAKKELDELTKKIDGMRDEIERETNKALMSMMNRIGTTVAVGKVEGTTVTGYGGHYVADESIAACIDHLIEDGLKLEELDSTRRAEMRKLEEGKWEKQRKLDELRAKDVQKYMEEKAKAPAAEPAVEVEDRAEAGK